MSPMSKVHDVFYHNVYVNVIMKKYGLQCCTAQAYPLFIYG